MSDEAALLKAIVAQPDEDLPRLVYADWLDENRPDRLPSPAVGPSARAEFIRTQCRLAAGGFDDPDYPALLEREADLAAWLNTHDREPAADLPELLLPEELEGGEWGDSRRGFAEVLAFNESCGYGDTPGETAEKIAAALEEAFTRTPARTLRLQGATAEEVALLARQPVFRRVRGLALDLGDGNEDEDEAVAALARSPFAAGLRRLYFDCLLDTPGLTALARSSHLGGLESLAIDLPIPSKALRALGRARWLPNIRRLHLWPSGGDALRALADLPSMPRLASLSLRGLTDVPAAMLRRFVASEAFPNLAHLDVAEAYLPADRLAILGQGRWPLRHLVLARNEVRKAGAEALAGARFAPGLRVLDLRECAITAGGVQALADSEALAGLRHLDLSDNPIGPGGLAAVAGSVALRGLRSLTLQRTNSLRGPIAARDVFAFLSDLRMPELRHLELAHLPVGGRGARVLAGGWRFANLTRLGLQRCRLGEEAVRALVRSPALADLVVLDLQWNKPGSAAARLADPKVFPRLAACCLTNNRLPRATVIRLRRRTGIMV